MVHKYPETRGQTIGLLVVMYFKNPLRFPNIAPYYFFLKIFSYDLNQDSHSNAVANSHTRLLTFLEKKWKERKIKMVRHCKMPLNGSNTLAAISQLIAALISKNTFIRQPTCRLLLITIFPLIIFFGRLIFLVYLLKDYF